MYVHASEVDANLPATVIGRMIKGGDAVKQAAQLFLCQISWSTLHIREREKKKKSEYSTLAFISELVIFFSQSFFNL